MGDRRSGWLVLAVFVIGCADNNSGVADMAVQQYSTSACGTCVAGACQAQIQACGNDPGCTSWYACLKACSTVGGDADPSCESACPAVTSAAGMTAKQNLNACRATGAGAQCAACGRSLPDAGALGGLLTQQCSASMEPDPCDKCEMEKCCQTYEACHVDSGCQTQVNCINACPDDDKWYECRYQCELATTAGLKTLKPRIGCRQALCSASCDLPNTCRDCLLDKCLESYIGCRADPDCGLLNDCGATCPAQDQACFDACRVKHPAGVKLLDEQTNCGLLLCDIECA